MENQVQNLRSRHIIQCLILIIIFLSNLLIFIFGFGFIKNNPNYYLFIPVLFSNLDNILYLFLVIEELILFIIILRYLIKKNLKKIIILFFYGIVLFVFYIFAQSIAEMDKYKEFFITKEQKKIDEDFLKSRQKCIEQCIKENEEIPSPNWSNAKTVEEYCNGGCWPLGGE